MKVALTAWENRISPVFDSANTLLIAEIKDAKVINRQYESFNPAMAARLPEVLTGFGIDTLICGAISKVLSDIIQITGIKLIAFIGGNVDEVLESYAKGLTIVPDFLMPGCARQSCHRRGQKQPLFEGGSEVITMPKKDGTGPGGQKTGKGLGGCPQGKGGGARPGKGSGQGKGQGCGQGRGCK